MIEFLDLKSVTELYSEEIQQAAHDVIDSGWYLQGGANATFEAHYANYIGSKFCVGVANGLDALIWIYRAYIEKYSGNYDLMNKYLVKYINGIIIADSAKGIKAEFNELKKDFGIEDYKEFLVKNKKNMFNNPDSRFRIVKKVTF